MQTVKLSNPRSMNLTGCLLLSKQNDQPHIVQMPNNPDYWVLTFTDVHSLKKSCAELNITDYKIKEITDGRDFLESIREGGARVMLNPYLIRDRNVTHWTEILLEEELEKGLNV